MRLVTNPSFPIEYLDFALEATNQNAGQVPKKFKQQEKQKQKTNKILYFLGDQPTVISYRIELTSKLQLHASKLETVPAIENSSIPVLLSPLFSPVLIHLRI